MRLRRIIFNLHLYLGVLAGLVLTVTGLSGTALVFRPEIDRWLEGDLLHVRPAGDRVSLQAVLEAVKRRASGQPVRYVFPPRTRADTFRVQLAGSGVNAYVHPYSGEVLGLRAPDETLTGVLYSLHSDLLGGESGKTVVGVGGVVLLLLGLTGLILWWPGFRGVGRGLRVQWRSGWKRLNFDVHRVLGVLALPVLVVSSLTGTALVFSGFFTDALHGLAGTTANTPKVSPVASDGLRPLPLDPVVNRAEAALPGAQVTRIGLPLSPESPVVVRMKLPREAHPNGMSFVHLDPYRGRVLAVQDVTDARAAGRVLNWRYPLHTGSFGGIATRGLTAVAGLTPAVLTVTGLFMWWNRTRTRRRTRAVVAARTGCK